MFLDEANPKAFIEYSNNMNDVYNNIHNYNTKRRWLFLMTWLLILTLLKKFKP